MVGAPGFRLRQCRYVVLALVSAWVGSAEAGAGAAEVVKGAGRRGVAGRCIRYARERWEVLLGGSGLDVSETWRTLCGVRQPAQRRL